MRVKRGVSLLEIIIVLAIFTIIGVTFLSYLSQSSKGMKFTDDYFKATVLSQKVLEDIMGEIAVNPYGLNALGIDKKETTFHEVVDGKSIFFSYVEDLVAPFGEIDPVKDGGISKSMQPVYDEVKKFRFNFLTKKLAESGDTEDRNIHRCSVKFAWNTDVGGGTLINSCDFFSPVTAKKIDLNNIKSIKNIDARIPEEVFLEPKKSISEIAALTGENVETILALGRISIVTKDFACSSFFADWKGKIQMLEKKLSTVSKLDYSSRYKYIKSIADAWYLISKNSFQIVICLQPSFDVLLTSGKFSNKTLQKFNAVGFQQNLFYYRLIYGYFIGSIEHAKYNYYKLLEKDIVKFKGEKFQMQVILKLLDLYRIIAILPNKASGMSDYKKFLKKVKLFSNFRIPSLYRIVLQEEELIKSKNKWLTTFPNLQLINTALYEKMPKILSFIKTKSESVITGN